MPLAWSAFGAVDNQVDRLSRAFQAEVLFNQLGPPAGVDQVVKANPGDIHFLQQIEDGRDVTHIELVDGETAIPL
jgi:hypothetical protein